MCGEAVYMGFSLLVDKLTYFSTYWVTYATWINPACLSELCCKVSWEWPLFPTLGSSTTPTALAFPSCPHHRDCLDKKPFQSRKDGLAVQGSGEGTEGEIQGGSSLVQGSDFIVAQPICQLTSSTILLTTKVHDTLNSYGNRPAVWIQFMQIKVN